MNRVTDTVKDEKKLNQLFENFILDPDATDMEIQKRLTKNFKGETVMNYTVSIDYIITKNKVVNHEKKIA